MRVDNFTTKVVSTNIPTIHLVTILDSSGSMNEGVGSKWDNAVKGVQQEIEALKQDTSINYIYSLVVFGNSRKNVIWQQPIQEVVYDSSWRSQSATALYQTIGATLESYPTDYPVLVKIYTDGQHNVNTGKYSKASEVSALLQQLKKKDVTVTFIGTEYDVAQIQRDLNIAKGNTLVHDNTGVGMKESFKKSLDATQSYLRKVATGEFTKTLNFYQ